MYASQWRVQIQLVFLWGVSKVGCGEMLLSTHSMPAQHPLELTELILLRLALSAGSCQKSLGTLV
jgi:hypothetical protein